MKRRTLLQMASLAPVAAALPAQAHEQPPEGLKKGAGEATVELVTTFKGGYIEVDDFDGYVGWTIVNGDTRRWIGTTREVWETQSRIDASGRQKIAEAIMDSYAWTSSPAYKKATEEVFRALQNRSFM